MLKELESQFILAQKENNRIDRLKQLKTIRNKVIRIITDPLVSIEEKVALNELMKLMAFSSN